MMTLTDFSVRDLPIQDTQLTELYRSWCDDTSEISLFSSGSTGKPQEHRFSKAQVVASAQRTAEYFSLDSGSTLLLALPIEFTGGRMMALRAMHLGCRLITTSPSSTPDIGVESDLLSLTPHQLTNLLREGRTDELRLHRNILLGGAPLDADIRNELLEEGLPFFESYGMTETLSHVAIRPHGSEVFQWMDGLEVDLSSQPAYIKDHLTGVSVQTQDILLPGPQGGFTWVGRADDVINTGGVKLHPSIVEAEISRLTPHAVQLSWVPDEQLGQQLVLLVEGVTGKGLAELHAEIREKLPKIQVPKGYVIVTSLLRTESSKLKREENRVRIEEKEIIWKDTIAY